MILKAELDFGNFENEKQKQKQKADLTNSTDNALNVIFPEFGLMSCESGSLDANGSR